MTEATESVQDDCSSVKVAVRVRPQLARERIDMCQTCTTVPADEPQIFLGKDKAFTFDCVFDIDTQQEELYEKTAKSLIEGTFDGYNATIFAYGQTGSGKTYTMGTGFEMGSDEIAPGIVPRAVAHLFDGIEKRKRDATDCGEPPPDFKVNAHFMELYNEEIIDLFDTTRDPSERNRKSHIRIHEDACGGIYCVGVTTRPVATTEETLQCLKLGALSRTTASTNMNASSSRSHAIFTLHIKQHRLIKEQTITEEGKEQDTTELTNEFETLTAKFHFVDLAGSERLKRTGATGDRQKEGISINCGLLALGNVISALGDKQKKASHVPYRDSKLTRLLQDSLGGNSRTMMIACISPSDRDFMETLNTLKYANRAKNIRNKVTVNQDKTSRQIAALRAEIQRLQDELNEYKSGKRLLDADGVETVNDMFHENTMLQTENTGLRQRIKAVSSTVESLRDRNSQLLAQRDMANIASDTPDDVQKLVQSYIAEIEDLRCKLMESESICDTLRRHSSSTPASRMSMSPGRAMTAAGNDTHVQHILQEAKRDLDNSKKQLQISMTRSVSMSSDKSGKSTRHNSDSEGESGGELEDGTEDGVVVIGENGEEEHEDDDSLDEDEDINLKDSDSEGEDDIGSNEKLHEDLADLQCEISIKQKLIDELAVSQKRLHAMKAQYEGKLMSLQQRIRETELERDKVLNNLGSIENQQSEAVKKEKAKFEKKLSDMNNDLKKLQAAKKEHSKLLRNKSHYEKQLSGMTRDLDDLKRLKVKLMNQIKTESAKSREAESRRKREIASLKREQVAKDNKIRGLQTEKRTRDLVLKRKQEEVKALRQRQQPRPMSAKAAGRVNQPPPKPTKKPFSPRAAKSKWDAIEKSVSSIVLKKQTMSHMERDMERWLKQRDSLTKKVERVHRKQESALAADNSQLAHELGEQLHSLRSNIAFVQDNINECQSNIMSMEETKNDDQEPVNLFNKTSNVEEAKYLLEHFLNMVINKGLVTAQKDAENKELVAKLHQERMDTTFQRDMLQYLIADKVDIDFDESVLNTHVDDSDSDSESLSSPPSSRSTSPIDRLLADGSSVPTILKSPMDAIARLLPPQPVPPSSDDSLTASTSSIGRKDKARRKTTTPLDLLGGATEAVPLSLVPEVPPAVAPKPTSAAKLMPPPPPPKPRNIRPDSAGAVRADPSPSMARKRYNAPDPSPSMRRKHPPQTTTSTGSLSRQTSNNAVSPTEQDTPPSSPSAIRRSRDENVFSRLTSQTAPVSPHPSRRRKSMEKSTVPEAKEERGSQILWRLWLERRQGRKRGTSEADGSNQSKAEGAEDTAISLNSHHPKQQQQQQQEHYDNGISLAPENAKSSVNTSNSLSKSMDCHNTSRSSQEFDSGTVRISHRQRMQSSTDGSDDPMIEDDDSDVFERLSVPKLSRGVINAAQGRSLKQSPLVHSHTAVGHHKAVLSVFATEDLMFSSSKDRTAKVWDLMSGEEILTLDGHPNNVVSVRYSPETSLVYTVSTYFCKVWDVRAGNNCIRTLLSSGLTQDGSIAYDPSVRQVACPPGETVINDVALNSSGSVLYTAAGNNVRIWDLRSYKAVGKLSGGHQAAVMVLAVDDTDTADGNICVVTGSKDHYIKVFDVDEDSVGVLTPKYNLEPPHYDGIQSLCLMGDLLFSGSRDTCIKKWDLSQQQLQQSINNAHKDWVCGLSFLPGGNCLLSGCRSGYVKLWHIDNCNLLGEIKAHNNPINSITTNSTCIFTASNDRSIRIWKSRYTTEASDASDLE